MVRYGMVRWGRKALAGRFTAGSSTDMDSSAMRCDETRRDDGKWYAYA